jgi:hypothetical protein
MRMGVILIKLSSNPVHAIIHDEEEIVIKVPKIMKEKNKKFFIVKKIKKKEI